jgi:asparagine synthetase B (glutamine-hydrolysing)
LIFDLYIELDLGGNTGQLKPFSFKKDDNYKEIKGDEHFIELKYGYAVSLNRRNFSDNYIKEKETHVWIFGFVYTNKKYQQLTGKKCGLLKAEEILAIRSSYPDKWQSLLKGSYVIIIYNELENELQAYTDYLNVLPLYYSFDRNKLIVSSNTAFMLKRDWVDKTPDQLAFTMQHLFDYMLGENYFVLGIRRMENARCYSFNEKGIHTKIYWDVSELWTDKLLSGRSSLDLIAEQLKENVNLYADYATPLLVSLTGGFDGRTNMAMIGKDKAQMKCYSYGMPGSKQITIPETIAGNLHFNYEPVKLDDNFCNNYYLYNEKSTYFSNGTAPIGFGNITYAFSRLANYSDTVLTGLFGSELLRPMNNNQIQINDQSIEIFMDPDNKEGIKKALENRRSHQFMDFDINDQADKLQEYFQKNYFTKYKDHDRLTQLFFFLMQEGMRKYFSQEISAERVYVSTKTPYYDMDSVELIYKTTWAGLYNGFLGKSKFKRRKGQLLYAHIMKKYWPEIMQFKMDRGYKPSVLLWKFPFNYIAIAYGIFTAKRYKKVSSSSNETFDTKGWAKETLQKIKEMSSGIMKINLKADPENENDKIYLTYRHFASLKLFLSKL